VQQRLRALVAILLLAAGSGCDDASVGPAPAPPAPSTWTTIRDDIFQQRCVSCHVAGSSFARQSDLVLTADVAYAQLVEVRPNNAAARTDSLWRLGRKGLPSLYESFLWEKIDARSQAHFYTDHPQYGSMMPLGEPPLTNGELEYIRRWIVAGCPETGDVVERNVLDDETRYEPPAFVPIAPPANGVQFHLSFTVEPGPDREVFYYEPLNPAQDLLLERIEISMSPGSHHFLFHVYRDNTPGGVVPVPRQLRDVRSRSGVYDLNVLRQMLWHDFFAGTQWPVLRYSFPPGVALRLPAGKGLDLNSHYVNRGTTPIQAEVYANLHYADPAQVQHVAEVLSLINEDILLPPHRVTTLERTYTFSEPVRIFQLFSHAHEHMLYFEARVTGGSRDGELVYFARDWAHPPILQLDPPLDLQAGEGLTIAATYDNRTDREIRFGLLASDEMMILFGYYYPTSGKQASIVAIP
jgi:hypothetical protein